MAIFGPAASCIKANQIIVKNGKNLSQIIAKNAIFGQAVSYIGSKSNYCQKWLKLAIFVHK